jgi:hypothetical protein
VWLLDRHRLVCGDAQDPLLPDASELARRQARAWADVKSGRLGMARRMVWRSRPTSSPAVSLFVV